MIINPTFIKELADRKYIGTKDPNNIFIEAGAGAGKSTSLIDRIYYLLLKGVPAKNIYAITFTNKATEELRLRIVKFLKDFSQCSPDEIDKKKQLLTSVDDIHISTIHKFSEDILKENAVKAGLSPNFGIAINDDEVEIKRRVISQYFRLFKDWNSFKDFETSLFVNKKGVKKLIRDDIVSLFNSMLTTVDRITNYNQIYKCSMTSIITPADFRNCYVDFFNELDRYCTMNTSNGASLDLVIKSDIEEAGYVNAQSVKERNETIDIFISGGLSAILKLKGSPFMGNRGSKQKRDDALLVFKPLVDRMKETYAQYNIQYVKLCLKYAYDLYQYYLRDRDSDVDVLTNNDLIYRTFTLLKNDKDVLNKVRNKVQNLFIDEYQDTDSVQYKIASLITDKKDGCLYIVGDPKQSIYRFRGAEPDVFFETKREFSINPSTHNIYDLNINFRSNSKIIEWVNNRYQKIGLIDPALSYLYKPMMYHPENDIPQNEYDDPQKLIGFYKYEKCEPSDVKDLIFFLKNNMLIRKDKKKGNMIISGNSYTPQPNEYRNIDFDDIMVLLENHKEMPAFVEEFTKNNIPARVYGESRFVNTLAIRSFVNLYSAILLKDRSSVAQAEAVFRTLHKSLYVGKTLEESMTITTGLINELKNRTNKMNAYGKAIYLIEHLSLLMKDNHLYQDFEINFAESKLYQMVEEVFSKGFYNGIELIEIFNVYSTKIIERESLIQNDIKAVMVINLHKAKGLQAPIVIWVSTVERNNRGSDISGTYKNGMLYPSLMINTVRKSSTYQHEVLDLGDDERYEDARKEYVAVTRPQEAFIFVDSTKHVSLFHNEERNYQIFDSPDVRNLPLPKEEDTQKIEEEEEENNEIVIPNNPELEENAEEDTPECLDTECSYVEDSTGIKTTSPSSLESSVSPTRNKAREEAGELPPSNRPKSNDVGTILHRALELLIKEQLSVKDAVNNAIEENIDLVPTNNKDEFVKFFITCVKSFQEWFKHEGYELYPEFTFSYFDGKMINNGSIDLLMIRDDEYIIVDYKSDEAEYIKDDETFEITLKEKYEPQLNAYQKVVEEIFGASNIKKKIIYFRRYDSINEKIDVKSLEL